MQLNRKNIVLRKSTKIGTILTPKRLKFQKRIELLFVVCHKATVSSMQKRANESTILPFQTIEFNK